jgi:SCP-2 sterol transfer family/DinB superfamily
MNPKPLNNTFDPQTLADDLLEVRRIYAQFFSGLDEAAWDKPVKGGSKEWTLHETVAHLCALNEAGLEGAKHALRGEPYTFTGLDSRYDLNAYNRKGIDELLGMPMKALCAKLLDILNEAASVARNLTPDQAELTLEMSIYNRSVSIVEGLSIIMVHIGLFHSAQVAEPVGQPPLWMQLSPEIRHRVIGRVMRAFSLLYRFDIGGSLRSILFFRVDGPGGGEWYVDLSPEAATSGEGAVKNPRLVIRMRNTDVFCQMPTGRLNLPKALISGAMKLRGDLRLFLRMDSLFSVDARPKSAVNTRISPTHQSLTGDYPKGKDNPVRAN